jgi:short chain dehydrogenase
VNSSPRATLLAASDRAQRAGRAVHRSRETPPCRKASRPTIPLRNRIVSRACAQRWSPSRARRCDYRAAGKLEGKAALITGGDSGIGRAVAIGFAKEGADVAIVYLDEHEDAASTKALVEEQGRRCLTIAGDVGDEAFCQNAVARTVETFGKLDLLVNNAGEQHPQDNLEDIGA